MPRAPDRIQGTINKYFEDRGFGFLTTVDINDGGSTDVFFHITDVRDYDRVREKWRLECTPRYDSEEGGWRAVNAEVIAKDPDRGDANDRRKLWYQRASTEELREHAGDFGKEIMERKQEQSDTSEDDESVRYDPSDHV